MTTLSFDDLIPSQSTDRYSSAISSIESGGRYDLVGPETRTGDRALGKYQVMSKNVPEWSREILGRELTPQEFLASPDAQEAIFKGKFGQYVSKYGPEGASRAWFAGEKGMHNPNARDVLGTSVSDYSQKFARALGYAPEGAQAAPVAARPAPASLSFDDLIPQRPGAQPAPGGVTTIPAQGDRPARVIMDMGTPSAQPAPEQPTGGRGAFDAGARGAAQGITANFYDELRGLMEAGGLNPNDPASLTALLSGAIQYFAGSDGAAQRYNAAVERERGLNKEAEEQHPIANTVGGLAGAIAAPIGVAANAATLPGRMAVGAGVGAGFGGLSGAGEGETTTDRASRAAVGAGFGGALGGVAPAAIEGVVRGARALSAIPANTLRGITNPDAEAARRVGAAIQRDIRLDPSATARLTPQEFAQSVQTGGPAAVLDLGGETTRALARSAANTSPEGRAVLNRAINDRFETQSNRLSDWLRGSFNYPNADAQQEALAALAKASNKPAYAKAYAQGRVGYIDDELREMAQAPVMQQAIRAAVKNAQNKSAGGALGPNTASRWANGDRPTLEFWDQVKRQLDDEINVAKRAGRNEEFATLTQVKNALVTKLDSAFPTYKAARAGAAEAFGAQDALDAGRKFVTSRMSNNEARKLIAKMTPEERRLFQDGFVSEFVDALERVPDRRNVLNKVADSAPARERLDIALGVQKARELEVRLRIEGIMDFARNAVQGNSTTARQLAELGLAGGAYGLSTGGNITNPSPSAVINSLLIWGAARGRNKINESVSRRVAEMLASRDPEVVRKAVFAVTKSEGLFKGLRVIDKGLARISGGEAATAPSIGIGRAEDQPEP